MSDMHKRVRDMLTWISILQVEMASRVDMEQDEKDQRQAVMDDVEMVTSQAVKWQMAWESAD
jgi:hypothetical protein